MKEPDTFSTDPFTLLRRLELLRGISDVNLRELSELGRPVSFPKGAIIFRNHDPAACCYVVTDGTVSLEVCDSAAGCTQILTIGNGELLGWSPLLGQPFFTSTAKTTTPTKAIEFTGQEIINLCEQQPRFGYEFMRCTALALSKRLTATRLQLLDMFRGEQWTTGKPE